MPIDVEFVAALVAVFQEQGWQVQAWDSRYPNPLRLRLQRQDQQQNLIVYARRVTRQRSDTSSHNRPPGEMHMQMTFDDSQRGRGIRNRLQFEPDSVTVLWGFFEYSEASEYLIAAFDPAQHAEYGYSKSIQVKYETLARAQRLGVTFQERSNGEVIVALPLTEVLTYLDEADSFHNTSLRVEAKQEAQLSPEGTRALDTREQAVPELHATERRRVIREVSQALRDARFSRAIRDVYERCAICGFQYDDVLDAAHIIPVSEGGTDTYENGMGLCPTCHRMYDRGLVLVDENYMIHLNTDYAEEYNQQGRADSLDDLQQRLRTKLWLPTDEAHHPSRTSLQQVFHQRRGSR